MDILRQKEERKIMGAVLVRASCFIAIIVLGYVLRKVDFFHEGDFTVLSKIVLKITLPAAIVYSLSDVELAPSMLVISLIGLLCGGIYIPVMLLLNARRPKPQQAFEILNCSGYNIGNFTLPFVQSFLGPVGVMTTSLFDVGNAVICLGGAYSAASTVKGGSGGITVGSVIRRMMSSVAFDAYLVMTVLCLLKLRLPEPVISFAGIISNANAFAAMLMIGVGFRLSGNREQIGAIARIVTVRYSLALVFSLGLYFLLPLALEYRQALAILVFAPIGSAAPAFTELLGEDVGLASAVNSISIVISILCIVAALALVL